LYAVSLLDATTKPSPSTPATIGDICGAPPVRWVRRIPRWFALMNVRA
jgi:hypothetical protein